MRHCEKGPGIGLPKVEHHRLSTYPSSLVSPPARKQQSEAVVKLFGYIKVYIQQIRRIAFACTILTCVPQSVRGEPEWQAHVQIDPSKRAGLHDDDIARIKRLVGGVGWDFDLNDEALDALKQINVTTLRCINSEPLSGVYDRDGRYHFAPPARLVRQMEACRAIGAQPHMIIGTGIPKAMLADRDAEKGRTNDWSPEDWQHYQAYCLAFFEYVVVEQAFSSARFEVGNEPDTAGSFLHEATALSRGGDSDYKYYYKIYENVAEAAREFERRNPGRTLSLGGPAITLAYTFRHGAFLWMPKFIHDCREGHLKLDFVSAHYYGNTGSVTERYPGAYPSLTEMLGVINKVRNAGGAGIPLVLSEWGPSYQITTPGLREANCDNMSAAWSAAFILTILEQNVDTALLLAATDNVADDAEKRPEEQWGWPALFLNPRVSGGLCLKPIYHLGKMMVGLSGQRVHLASDSPAIIGICSLDRERNALHLVIANYDAALPESAPFIDYSKVTAVQIALPLKTLPAASRAIVQEDVVDAQSGNAWQSYKTFGSAARNAGVRSSTRTVQLNADFLTLSIELNKSSVVSLDIRLL